jgi:dTDP-4-dehydrorhamnose reductase
MRVMILGCQGQLGSELVKLYGEDGVSLSREQVDITVNDSIASHLESNSIDCVINAAAYNKVDQAEDEPELAYRINALGPRNLALTCARYDVPLVHISSDYVFGLQKSNTPWVESDCPIPNSAYSVSKLAGEHFVRSISAKHLVIRTCGLYGHAARNGTGKGNFVETMLRLGSERKELRIIDDQFCTPTSVKDLAIAISQLILTSKYGLYHATNAGECTWASFAEEIFKQAKMNTQVVKISTSEYPTKAKRPSYSLLNCQKLNSLLKTPFPRWENALALYLEERKSSN